MHLQLMEEMGGKLLLEALSAQMVETEETQMEETEGLEEVAAAEQMVVTEEAVEPTAAEAVVAVTTAPVEMVEPTAAEEAAFLMVPEELMVGEVEVHLPLLAVLNLMI